MTSSLRFTHPRNVKKRKGKTFTKNPADKNRQPVDIYVYLWFCSVGGIWIWFVSILLKVSIT